MDKVLKELGEEPTAAKKVNKSDVKKLKKKSNKNKKKIDNINEDGKPIDPIDAEEPQDKVSSEVKVEVMKESLAGEECSICFGIRIHTFVFVPCGHATFCEDCASRIFNEVKKCPTCQALITHSVRLYQ